MKLNYDIPKVLCQINDVGFTRKPTDIRFMGKLRDKMIQRGWQQLSDVDFVRKVTEQGHCFYGCIFNGRDLMETGQQRLCWRMQTIIAMDFDHCPVSPEEMCAIYAERGLDPWLCYGTFSDGDEIMEGKRSYRILWKVAPNLAATYEQVHAKIRELAAITPYADKHSQDCSRMWQGSRNGFIHYDATAPLLEV